MYSPLMQKKLSDKGNKILSKIFKPFPDVSKQHFYLVA